MAGERGADMAISTPRDVFIHELGAIRDGERTGGPLLGWLGRQVQNGELSAALRAMEEECHQHLNIVRDCMNQISAAPLDTPSTIVEGIRTGYEQFVQLQPTPLALDIFALLAALRFAHYGIASYKGTVLLSEVLCEQVCLGKLQAILRQKTESAKRLEEIGRQAAAELRATVSA